MKYISQVKQYCSKWLNIEYIHELSNIEPVTVLFKDFWCNIHIFRHIKGYYGIKLDLLDHDCDKKVQTITLFGGYLNRNLFFGLGGKKGSTYFIWFGHLCEREKNPTQTIISPPIPFPFLTLSEWDFLLSFCHLLTPLAHHSIFSSLLHHTSPL